MKTIRISMFSSCVYLLGLIPLVTTLGFLSNTQPLYILALMLSAAYALLNAKKGNFGGILFIVICALSIIGLNPPSVFKSWQRLAFFVLLMLASFPICSSLKLIEMRRRAFRLSMWGCVVISVTCFACYFLGINYAKYGDSILTDYERAGAFSGIVNTSMMMAPISAFATIFLFSEASRYDITKKRRRVLMILAFITTCVNFIGSSRGATVGLIFAGLAMLYGYNRKHLSRLIGNLCKVCLLVVLLFPIYMPYAERVLEKQELNESNGSTFYSRESKWQNRIDEFESSPLLGCGFAAMDINHTEDYNRYTGTSEPGSSVLSVLSTLGLIGFVIFVAIYIKSYRRAYKSIGRSRDGLLLFGIMSFFCVHLIVEGYIFAAGSYLCFIFWLSCGCAASLNSSQAGWCNQTAIFNNNKSSLKINE